MRFKLKSDFSPTGDQPEAIDQLVKGIESNEKFQTLLGVTGSGKTYTVANVIERTQKPTLVLAHNKTLAAQLYAEFKYFFPDNLVEYFVSHGGIILSGLYLTFVLGHRPRVGSWKGVVIYSQLLIVIIHFINTYLEWGSLHIKLTSNKMVKRLVN